MEKMYPVIAESNLMSCLVKGRGWLVVDFSPEGKLPLNRNMDVID